jgi:hypothetical protein
MSLYVCQRIGAFLILPSIAFSSLSTFRQHVQPLAEATTELLDLPTHTIRSSAKKVMLYQAPTYKRYEPILHDDFVDSVFQFLE